MDITFRTRKLALICTDSERAKKEYGTNRAKRLRQRLDDLYAAITLEDMRQLPGRCHELTQNLSGVLSVDLDGPYRLLFVPNHDPLPRKDDGGLDWTQITAITIISVEDTHG